MGSGIGPFAGPGTVVGVVAGVVSCVAAGTEPGATVGFVLALFVDGCDVGVLDGTAAGGVVSAGGLAPGDGAVGVAAGVVSVVNAGVVDAGVAAGVCAAAGGNGSGLIQIWIRYGQGCVHGLGHGTVAEKMLTINAAPTKRRDHIPLLARSIAGTANHSHAGMSQNSQRNPLQTPA